MKRNADFSFSDRSRIQADRNTFRIQSFSSYHACLTNHENARLTFLMDLKNHRILSGTCHPIPSLPHKNVTVLSALRRNDDAGASIGFRKKHLASAIQSQDVFKASSRALSNAFHFLNIWRAILLNHRKKLHGEFLCLRPINIRGFFERRGIKVNISLNRSRSR